MHLNFFTLRIVCNGIAGILEIERRTIDPGQLVFIIIWIFQTNPRFPTISTTTA
jgi:hypothetical protein